MAMCILFRHGREGSVCIGSNGNLETEVFKGRHEGEGAPYVERKEMKCLYS